MFRHVLSRQMYWLLTSIMVGAGGFALVADVLKAEPTKEDKPAISLSIAAVLNAPGPTFTFTMTNNSDKDVPYYAAGAYPSIIAIVTPGGKEEERFILAGRPGPDFKQPMLKPGESMSRKENIFELFGTMRFKSPGTYRLYWRLGRTQDGAGVQYKSNEIPIIREKGTPIFHSAHGIALPEEFYQDNPDYQ